MSRHTPSCSALALLGLCAAAGCGTFQDPNIVVDLRVLAMTASVPEQVVDVDLANPQFAQILAQMVPSEVCALVGDPGNERVIRWTMTLCVSGDGNRCDSDQPEVVLGSGTIDDPDVAVPEPQVCVTVKPDGNVLGIALAALKGDAFGGLGGVDYEVQLRVGGRDANPDLDLFAGKTLRVAARIPADRRANHNPSIDHIDLSIDDGAPVPLPLGRCIDQTAPFVVMPGTKVRMTPIEPDGVREDYVVPTIDGGSEMFTESLTYQWTAVSGGFSKGTTGGKRDVTGNPPPLFTDWTAPSADDITTPTDIPIWIVQRDERLGGRWYESCIRVVP